MWKSKIRLNVIKSIENVYSQRAASYSSVLINRFRAISGKCIWSITVKIYWRLCVSFLFCKATLNMWCWTTFLGVSISYFSVYHNCLRYWYPCFFHVDWKIEILIDDDECKRKEFSRVWSICSHVFFSEHFHVRLLKK